MPTLTKKIWDSIFSTTRRQRPHSGTPLPMPLFLMPQPMPTARPSIPDTRYVERLGRAQGLLEGRGIGALLIGVGAGEPPLDDSIQPPDSSHELSELRNRSMLRSCRV